MNNLNEKENYPIIDLHCHLEGAIDPKKSIETINRAARQLGNGISTFFFGEGYRSSGGDPLPLKKGGIAFAIQTKLLLVPITIINSGNFLPRRSLGIKA